MRQRLLIVIALLAIVLLTTTSIGQDQPAKKEKIAFVSDRDGNQEIYIMYVDGLNVKRLTNNEDTDIDPAWSPVR